MCLFCLMRLCRFCLTRLFCLMRQNKMHGFIWADQDWIGLMIFKTFADQDWIGFNFCGSGLDSDWKFSQSAHLWYRVEEVLHVGTHEIFYWPHTEETITHKVAYHCWVLKAFERGLPSLLQLHAFDGRSRDGDQAPWVAASKWSLHRRFSLLKKGKGR